jgi:alkanesulfonate monooxygenase
LDLLARETEEEAIFDAERYWQQPGGRNLGGAPTVDELLWAGLTSDSTGAAATLVGSYEQVVQALIGYFAAGIDSFLLSAVPHFEEAYRLGEHVLPIVRSQVSPEQRRAVGGLA